MSQKLVHNFSLLKHLMKELYAPLRCTRSMFKSVFVTGHAIQNALSSPPSSCDCYASLGFFSGGGFMLREVSGFSGFTSRGSVFTSSATNSKSLINANVMLIHSFQIQPYCKQQLSWGFYKYKFFKFYVIHTVHIINMSTKLST